MKIKEVIVVEGKCDTVAIQRAVQADTIETNGSAINEETLNRIAFAHEIRGVIVFTDPDYPGRRIRAIIEERIPTVKHAFLTKKETVAKNGKGLGIEHASDRAIQEALRAVHTFSEATDPIPLAYLIEKQLIGHPKSKSLRDALSTHLQIGQVNGKGLVKRLAMFQITQNQVEQALLAIQEEREK